MFNAPNKWTERGARRQGRKDARRDFPNAKRPDLGYHSDVVKAGNSITSEIGERWQEEDGRHLESIRSLCNDAREAQNRREHIEKEMEDQPYREPHGRVGAWIIYGVIVVVEGAFSKSAMEGLDLPNFATWAATFAITALVLGACHYGGRHLRLHRQSPTERIATTAALVGAYAMAVTTALLRCKTDHGFDGSMFPIWLAYQLLVVTTAIFLAYVLADPLHEARAKQINAQTRLEQAVARRNKRHDRALSAAFTTKTRAEFLAGCYESENNRWRSEPLVFKHLAATVPDSLTVYDEDEWTKLVAPPKHAPPDLTPMKNGKAPSKVRRIKTGLN